MAVSSIHGIFDGQLATVATALGLDVAWENRDFKPGHKETYLKPHLLLATPTAAALGPDAKNKQTGIYQVNVEAPEGDGWGGAYGHADAIGAAFKRGTIFSATGITITCKSVAVGPALHQDGRYVLPVAVHFYAYINPDT